MSNRRRLTLRELLLSTFLLALGMSAFRLLYNFHRTSAAGDALLACLNVAVVFTGLFAIGAGLAIHFARLVGGSRSSTSYLTFLGGLIGAFVGFVLIVGATSVWVAAQYR